jgi:pimeloyl-ACP methyl ester carboxylesterase
VDRAVLPHAVGSGENRGVAARTLEVGGVSLYVVEEGEGPAVLLIHGMGLDHRMWDPQRGPLAANGYRVACYDTRGHGRSGVPPAGYALEDVQREALGVLAALDIDSAHIVGLSMGGSIAAHFAVRSPERVRSVTVVSSMASGYPGTSDFVLRGGTANLLTGAADELEAYREARLDSPLFAPTLRDHVAGPPLRKILLEALQTTTLLRELAAERARGWTAPTDWDLWSDGKRGVNALVLAGALDDSTFTGFALDSRALPRTTVRIVPDAAHMCNMSHPDEVNRELLELFRRAEAVVA